MGITVRVSGASFSNYLGIASPPQDGLLGDYLFGVDAASSIVNRANPDAPMTIAGTPTYSANGVTIEGSASGDSLSTGINDMADMTMVFVGNPNGNACGLMGGWTPAAATQVTALLVTNTINAQLRTLKTPYASFQTDVACAYASPLILVGRVKNDGGGLRAALDCFQRTAHTSLVETDASPRGLAGKPIVVQNCFNSGTFIAHAAGLYSRYVDDDEVLRLAAYYQTVMAGRGVNV